MASQLASQRERVAALVARVASEGRRLASLRPTQRPPGAKLSQLELMRDQEAREAYDEQEGMVSMAKDALALEQLRLDNMLKESAPRRGETEEDSEGEEEEPIEVVVPMHASPVDGKHPLGSGASESAGFKSTGEVGGVVEEKKKKRVGRVAKTKRALCSFLNAYFSSPSPAATNPLSKPPAPTQSRKWLLLSLVFLLYFSFHESAGLVLSGGLFGEGGGVGPGGSAHLRDVLGGTNGQQQQQQQRVRRPHPEFPPPSKCVAGPGWVSVRAPVSPPGYPPTGGDPGTPFTHPRVLILMLDDRRVPLEMPSWNQAREQYYALAAMRNYLWARSFGYDFAYLHPLKAPNMTAIGGGAGFYKGLMTPACFNSANGRWRGLSWCKVLALWAASSEDPIKGGDGTQPRYDLIVFMDSDAVVSNTSQPLQGALAKYHRMKWGGRLEASPGEWSSASGWEYSGGGGYVATEVQYGARGGLVATESGPTLFMYSDRQPNDWAVANLGFIIARDSPQLRPLLTTWWEIFPSQDAEKYDFEPHMEQAVMWHMQRGDEYVPGVVKDRTTRVVQVIDAPWAPIDKAGWLTHVTSEEDRGSFGESRKKFFRVIHKELNLTEAQWQWHVKDMSNGCYIMPIDLEALDQDLVAHDAKSLETLTEKELWAPLAPETVHPGTFDPISPA